jgi:hypothetical protein
MGTFLSAAGRAKVARRARVRLERMAILPGTVFGCSTVAWYSKAGHRLKGGWPKVENAPRVKKGLLP